jgi:hypothetical protein
LTRPFPIRRCFRNEPSLSSPFLLFALAPLLHFGNRAFLGTFSTVFAAIVLEALPFLLIGSVVSGLLGGFDSQGRVIRLLSKGGARTPFVAAALGLLFPVPSLGGRVGLAPLDRSLPGLPAAGLLGIAAMGGRDFGAFCRTLLASRRGFLHGRQRAGAVGSSGGASPPSRLCACCPGTAIGIPCSGKALL